MTRLVLLDNTVLTNVAQVGRPDLAFLLWPDIVASSPAALEEYAVGVGARHLPQDAWKILPAIVLTDEEREFALTLPAGLGAGERECLAAAVHRSALFATDDLEARRAARRYGVTLTGTLGMLILSIQMGFVTLEEGNRLLHAMIDAGFRSLADDLTPYV